jgi:hypothetical protein
MFLANLIHIVEKIDFDLYQGFKKIDRPNFSFELEKTKIQIAKFL